MGVDSAAGGWGPGPHRDEPYGEEPWDSREGVRPMADALSR